MTATIVRRLTIATTFHTIRSVARQFRITHELDGKIILKNFPNKPRKGFFLWISSSKNRLTADLIAFSCSLINPLLLFAMSCSFLRSLANLVCFFRREKALLDDPPSSRRRWIAERLFRHRCDA
ncbi:hypothetical protein BV898_15585 [Hypsibius exemplaris]|uniref:Uncharacterized protein n=1 Tax=Hypsibius exemplaris TaxID=2072580 RepID=A0A9X6NBU0_HYPEX|nr:hypothetical protein BV898_15585 [Hypsibius exemplaris]